LTLSRTSTDDPAVFDNTDEHRYEIESGGGVAGFALYALTDAGRGITFTHTEVERALEGKGLGSRLIKAALDDTRRRQLRANPVCPFITAYIRRHPEYLDLVDDSHLDGPTP
jgi:predicted GNAT family acetyltransferase